MWSRGGTSYAKYQASAYAKELVHIRFLNDTVNSNRKIKWHCNSTDLHTALKVSRAYACLNWYNIIKNMFTVNILFDLTG